jgi:hypothetical protein
MRRNAKIMQNNAKNNAKIMLNNAGVCRSKVASAADKMLYFRELCLEIGSGVEFRKNNTRLSLHAGTGSKRTAEGVVRVRQGSAQPKALCA